ncbi:glucan biosynthesis protein [Kiloniella laminariae]|uniref:Glucans biosynthesis protein G n=1 Tax=Kiloniella laminariae TaxID=454162 RepID=A0ABT4LNP5_9PROT|nr:glucan biosynthesis protein [Kiloniella laminariae]MCZ4282733.1 glucan biosynthesis protein [Kiloniella laminariae]
MKRRDFLLSTMALTCTGFLPGILAESAAGAAGLTRFSDIQEKAATLAKSTYEKPDDRISDFWKKMSVEQFSKIYYNPKAPLWNDGGPFQMQFFHPGGPWFHHTVNITLQENGKEKDQTLQPGMFWYEGEQPTAKDFDNLHFAGFRVHHQLNSEYYDELISFLGSNYFRVLGRGQQYGLSIRGLAIDTAEKSGEEFPDFRGFWIEKPVSGSNELVIMALLDSPSITGAYRFVVTPGDETTIDVEVSLFARKDINKLGLAPLTSMYLYGENSRKLDDYRPEVHDSDGLMIHNSQNEWLWRPLARRRSPTISSFLDAGTKGFGLCQRDRSYDSYHDLDSRYQLRPSIWIEPKGDWGKGHVELVEINSDLETTDNIVCYWVSDTRLKAGQSHQYSYRLTSFLDSPQWPPVGRTLSTREGPANRPGFSYGNHEEARYFIVEFEGADLDTLAADSPIEAIFTCQDGKIYDMQCQKNPVNNQWRVSFNLSPPENRPCDIRGYLKLGDRALTETWTYLYTGKPV